VGGPGSPAPRAVSAVRWASRAFANAGLSGWDDEPSTADDAHEDISPDDIPPGSPERRELLRRIAEANLRALAKQ